MLVSIVTSNLIIFDSYWKVLKGSWIAYGRTKKTVSRIVTDHRGVYSTTQKFDMPVSETEKVFCDIIFVICKRWFL